MLTWGVGSCTTEYTTRVGIPLRLIQHRWATWAGAASTPRAALRKLGRRPARASTPAMSACAAAGFHSAHPLAKGAACAAVRAACSAPHPRPPLSPRPRDTNPAYVQSAGTIRGQLHSASRAHRQVLIARCGPQAQGPGPRQAPARLGRKPPQRPVCSISGVQVPIARDTFYISCTERSTYA